MESGRKEYRGGNHGGKENVGEKRTGRCNEEKKKKRVQTAVDTQGALQKRISSKGGGPIRGRGKKAIYRRGAEGMTD